MTAAPKPLDLSVFDGITAGEWELFDEQGVIEVSQSGNSGRRPCIVGWPGFDSNDQTEKQNRKNARAISALPLILAECSRLQEVAAKERDNYLRESRNRDEQHLEIERLRLREAALVAALELAYSEVNAAIMALGRDGANADAEHRFRSTWCGLRVADKTINAALGAAK